MKDTDDDAQIPSETRTTAFYAYLRSMNEPPEAIEKFRNRIQKAPDNDTLTDFFVHEIRNAFNVVSIIDPEDKFTPDARAYEKAKEDVLKAKQGLPWFIQDGPIPKGVIENFFQTVELLGPWDAELSAAVFSHFKALITAYAVEEPRHRNQ